MQKRYARLSHTVYDRRIWNVVDPMVGRSALGCVSGRFLDLRTQRDCDVSITKGPSFGRWKCGAAGERAQCPCR